MPAREKGREKGREKEREKEKEISSCWKFPSSSSPFRGNVSSVTASFLPHLRCIPFHVHSCYHHHHRPSNPSLFVHRIASDPAATTLKVLASARQPARARARCCLLSALLQVSEWHQLVLGKKQSKGKRSSNLHNQPSPPAQSTLHRLDDLAIEASSTRPAHRPAHFQ
jgi:hypothetical protein